MHLKAPRLILYALTLVAVTPFCGHAQQWTKDIDCPTGTVYQDLRPQAGRQEFCERVLPGGIKVKDGPFRFWFSEGHPGDVGTYKDGREVGSWKECDRFDRCKQAQHEVVSPIERDRPGFRREIPVVFRDGKYVFDFASCWSTWLVKTGGEDLNLNIVSTPYRCDITYIPQHALESGGEGTYFCTIPFAVGKRELNSLDLIHELPKVGLPQFCRPQGDKTIGALELGEIATGIDVQTIVIEQSQGHPVLRFTLNRYAADLAVQVTAKQGPLTTRMCGEYDEPTRIVHEADGRTSFSSPLSNDLTKQKQQKTCLTRAFGLKP